MIIPLRKCIMKSFFANTAKEMILPQSPVAHVYISVDLLSISKVRNNTLRPRFDAGTLSHLAPDIGIAIGKELE